RPARLDGQELEAERLAPPLAVALRLDDHALLGEPALDDRIRRRRPRALLALAAEQAQAHQLIAAGLVAARLVAGALIAATGEHLVGAKDLVRSQDLVGAQDLVAAAVVVSHGLPSLSASGR